VSGSIRQDNRPVKMFKVGSGHKGVFLSGLVPEMVGSTSISVPFSYRKFLVFLRGSTGAVGKVDFGAPGAGCFGLGKYPWVSR
jgi:hypothetical protein